MTDDASRFRSQRLLDRDRSALVVVDVQQSLTPKIIENRRLVWNVSRLIRAAVEMRIQLEATEQYPKGLKGTVEELAALLPSRHEKVVFSAAAVRPMVSRLADQGINQIVLCGIETHICILQSALDLASEGFDIYVTTDAVGSREIEDHTVALQRMRDEGLSLVTTESVLFEWCVTAADPSFKNIRDLVQEAAPGHPRDVGFGRS